MPRLFRKCRDCGVLTSHGGRCPRCESYRREALRNRESSSVRYGPEWSRLRVAILDRDDYECRWCGAPANTVDHVLPREDGGSNDPENLVAACRSCNSRRGGQMNRR